MFNVSTKETDAIKQFSGQAKQLYIVKMKDARVSTVFHLTTN